jgi:hypothetical protein
MKKKPKLKKFSPGGSYNEQTPDWNKAQEAMNNPSDPNRGAGNNIGYATQVANMVTPYLANKKLETPTDPYINMGYNIGSKIPGVGQYITIGHTGSQLVDAGASRIKDKNLSSGVEYFSGSMDPLSGWSKNKAMLDNGEESKTDAAINVGLHLISPGLDTARENYLHRSYLENQNNNTSNMQYRHGGKHHPKIQWTNPSPGSAIYGNQEQFPGGGVYKENIDFLGTNYDDVGINKDFKKFSISGGNYIPRKINEEGKPILFNPHLNMEIPLKNNWSINGEYGIPTNNNDPYYGIGIRKQFPNGGMSDNPNAEVENSENTLNPDGSTNQYNGPSHEQGGIPTQLDPNTLIFSDRLKMPGTKKTFAELNKKNNTDKQVKVLEDDDASSTAKATAQLIKDLKNKKSLELFNIQEASKKAKLNNYANKLGIELPQQSSNQEQFRSGGIKKYWNGGESSSMIQNDANDNDIFWNNFWSKSDLSPDNGTFSYEKEPNFNDDRQRVNNEYNSIPNIITPETSSKIDGFYGDSNNEIKNPKIYNTFAYRDKLADNPNIYQSNISQPDKPPGKTEPNFWDKNGQSLQDASAGLAQSAPYLWSLHNNKFGKKYDTTTPYLITPHLLSDREAIKDNEIAYKTALYNSRQIGGPGTLGAMNNAYANKVMNDAKIRESFANQNAGILNQTDEFNVGQKNLARELNWKSKARAEDQAFRDIDGVATNMASSYKTTKENASQNMALKMMGDLYPDYRWDKKTSTWRHKIDNTELTEDVKSGKTKPVTQTT